MPKHSANIKPGTASAAAAAGSAASAAKPAQRAGKPEAKAAPAAKKQPAAATKRQVQPEPETEEEVEAEEEEAAEDEDADAAENADGADDAEDGEDAEDDEAASGEEEDADDDEEMTEEDRRMLAEEEAAEAEAGADGEDAGEADDAAAAPKSKSKHALVVDSASADAYTEAMAQRGVLYVSRVPPYMKAAKLRWLLEQMVPKHKKLTRIGRIFLTPEDESVARRRKKAGGNSGKRFVDGWVEFESKKVARWIADAYNAKPMGGPKRSRYAEDLWTLKYLKGFKWSHLTEKIGQTPSDTDDDERTHQQEQADAR